MSDQKRDEKGDEKGDEKILVPLAEGFEEIEAVAIVDVLRRAELDVTLAGLVPGPVRGAHGITLETDGHLGALDLDTFTTVVLPGGMPGTTHLMEDERVLGLVRRLSAAGRTTAAICAAPMVLQAAGVIEGVAVTSHPSVWERLGGARLERESRVVISGPLITSQGPGTALEFALALVSELRGPAEARSLAEAMLATN
jgi:4-methyl-5(b-hydroxyethyl)-thiazole monophosphate biosynthesis